MSSRILQINIKPNINNERGLPKRAIDDAYISRLGIEGDHNNFRFTKKENNPDMAVLIITKDIIDDLNNEGWPIKPGDLGENLTIIGLDYQSIKPGQVLEVGSAKIKVSFICDPCTNLKILPYVGDDDDAQLTGIIQGATGAASYEALVGEPGKAHQRMTSQSYVHILIILLIMIGNISYFMLSRRKN